MALLQVHRVLGARRFRLLLPHQPQLLPPDDNGHGTHCTGIVGAETDNDTGVAGACPGARVMVLKAGESSGMLYSAVWLEALRYAADNGAEVVSMSFGGTAYSTAEQEAVDYAWSRGVVLCAAAGNTGDETMVYPAGYEHVLGVGATDNRDQAADFSTYNDSVDLSAPGVLILSTMPTYPVAFTAYGISSEYAYGSGTSMATPMAAGVSALVRSRNPALPPELVVEAVLEGVEDRGDPGWDAHYGWGRLNARLALEAISLPPELDSVAPSSGKVGAEVVVRGSGFGDSRDGSSVFFGLTPAVEYLAWSEGEIRCVVPPLAPGEAPVRVTTPAGSSGSLPFTILPFEVEGRVSGGKGSVSPGSLEVPYGGSAVLSLAPAAGYHISYVRDNGEEVAVEDSLGMEYRLEDVREDHLVEVTFAAYSTTWYLAEGCTAAGMQTYVLVQNPGSETALLDLTFMTGGGPVPGPQDVELPPGSRATFLANNYVPGNLDVSTRVTSTRPVICERAMYGPGWAWAHDSIRGSGLEF